MDVFILARFLATTVCQLRCCSLSPLISLNIVSASISLNELRYLSFVSSTLRDVAVLRARSRNQW